MQKIDVRDKIVSERLNFREITEEDFHSVYNILKDKEVMYAWGHGFSENETREWIEKNRVRYKNEGYSYLFVTEKKTGNFVGLMGPLVEDIDGEKYIGVAYILDKKYWGFGYATEAVRACIKYAFDFLDANKVIAEIRPENINSCKVAERAGMKVEGKFIKVYKGEKMLHLIYSILKENRNK